MSKKAYARLNSDKEQVQNDGEHEDAVQRLWCMNMVMMMVMVVVVMMSLCHILILWFIKS
jgi:hypothetical protein